MKLPTPLVPAVTVVSVAVVWVLVFNLNSFLFAEMALSDQASWIFLPAAFRLLLVLLFRQWGAVGLMFGAFLTLPNGTQDNLVQEVLLAASSGVAPLLAVAFASRYMQLKTDLQGLRGGQILVMSVLCAGVNSVLVSSSLLLYGEPSQFLVYVTTIFVGDVLGAAIVLSVIVIAISVLGRARGLHTGH